MKERKDAKWRKAAAAWLVANLMMEAAKTDIRKLAGEETCYGAGVKHLWNPCAGSVDYKKVPELLGVDLEPYRGKARFKSLISAI